MTHWIEARIAQILSDNCVIINAGTNAGVAMGMLFVVLAQGETVKDPTTGETLGRWELPKGYLRVTHVQDRLATCEGFYPGRGSDESQVLSAAMIDASMRPEVWGGTSGRRLNVERSQVSGLPGFRPIGVGDVVRQIPPDSIKLDIPKGPGA